MDSSLLATIIMDIARVLRYDFWIVFFDYSREKHVGFSLIIPRWLCLGDTLLPVDQGGFQGVLLSN